MYYLCNAIYQMFKNCEHKYTWTVERIYGWREGELNFSDSSWYQCYLRQR